jgi:hypothetical protein
LAEQARVLWGGTSGIHEWVFSQAPGCVHVTTIESFAGEPVEADAARAEEEAFIGERR